jgi:hypothetical protein
MSFFAVKQTAWIGVALLLTACAQIPKQAFNPSMHADIAAIGVLDPENNGEVGVANQGHLGSGLGLIGSIYAAADISSKTREFTELAHKKSLDCAAEYKAALVPALQKAGYAVKILKVQRAQPGFLTSYDGLDRSVDAYLDLDMSCAYLSASATADYIPTVRSAVRLVKRKTREIVYSENISYGYELRATRAISLPADATFFFKDFSALTSDPDKAITGLRTGFPLVANQIADDLRRSDWQQKSGNNIAATTPTAKQPDTLTEGDSSTLRGGISGVTVEQIARRSGCQGGIGAELIGAAGTREIYRLRCSDGSEFRAKCEFHQCRRIQ